MAAIVTFKNFKFVIAVIEEEVISLYVILMPFKCYANWIYPVRNVQQSRASD